MTTALNKENKSDSAGDRGEVPDIAALMAEIRARIKNDVERNQDALPVFKTRATELEKRSAFPAGSLLRSDNLLYANRNYQFGYRSRGPAFTSKLPGILGKIVIKLKTKFIQFREFLLRDYIEAEKEFNAHLVRFLNDIGNYVDGRDSACFWELVHKIDYDITKTVERIERISDEQSASLRTAERALHDEISSSLGGIRRSIEGLEAARAQQQVKLGELNSVTAGLEAILAGVKSSETNGSREAATPAELEKLDYSYLLLENRYRGSEEEISKRQEFYLEYFKGAEKPVLEIGGGRGEMQKLFKQSGISSYSVDLDAAMVKLNKEKALDARHGDGIAHLAGLNDESIGGLVAIQVLEHLNKEQLENLFKLCGKKLVKGGKVAFETINPKSVLALSSNYFRDLTHVFPLHPETLAFVLELSGLKVTEIKMLSPVPQEAQLKLLKVEDYMTPRWAFAIERLNQNITQLNELLYGYQDYCIIAEKL